MPVPDFYGVPDVPVAVQVDTITLNHLTPAALSKTAIVSFPSLEAAGATPTADVITVFDVTTAKTLVLNTDYTLTPSGTAPENVTYTVTRVNSSVNSADNDTARVTYRYGTQQDVNYQQGEFQGEPAGTTSAPAGTAGFATNQPTTDGSVAGIGDQPAGGSLTDPAMGKQSSSETGAPGSEYAVTQVGPSAFGYGPGLTTGSPDTEGVYGGGQPANFTPAVVDFGSTANPGIIDTTIGGGAVRIDGTPPAYRAPSAGVAAFSKDTTLTDILGNQLNASAASPPSGYAATQVDTGYIGAPAQPTPLLSQVDTVAGAQAGTAYYLSQLGVVPSSIVVTNTTSSQTMVLGTDYTVTTLGNGPTTASFITPIVAAHFANGNNISIAYSYGDATYYDSNFPASVPGAPSITSATPVNRGVSVTWNPPAGVTPVDFYLIQSVPDLGTMYVPASGMPIEYGQPSPSGGGQAGQPTYQADTLTLLAAAIAAPAAPAPTTATTGGTVLAGTYKAVVTYVNANGETIGSAQGSVTTTGSTSTITVPSPASTPGATGWNAYVSQVGGTTVTKQNSSPIAIGTGLTLTAPPTSSGANSPVVNSTLPTTSKQGVITPGAQIIVRDVTSAAQTINAAGEIVGGEGDPMQAAGVVLELGYDYTVTQVGVGPWAQFQIALAAGSVNAAAGDQIIVEYWWSSPASVNAVFTQGIKPNENVIYKPDGSTPYNQGYAFRVAAGNRAGLGPYSALSAFVVPLNYQEAQPGHEGSITVGTGSLDPANAVNPIYRPDGTIKAGTGLGG